MKHHVKCEKPLEVPKNYQSTLMGDMEYIKVANLNPQKRKMERIQIYRQKQTKYYQKNHLMSKSDDHSENKIENRNQDLRRILQYKEKKKNYLLN